MPNITEDYSNGNPSFDSIAGIARAANVKGLPALLVMLAVLCFIFAYCCWGAPFCRNLCKKYCCCHLEDPEDELQFGTSNERRTSMVATPTIILLPHGRMIVVDGTVFNQYQTDRTGLDLVEHAFRNQVNNPRTVTRHQLQSSQGSILTTDGESLSKDIFPPPTYESIFGKEIEGSIPPSYSDLLLHRPYDIDVIATYGGSKEELEMHSLGSASCRQHIIVNPINNPYSMANNISSQSIACANMSRNSSLISEAGYYLNCEMECFQLERQNSSININTISSLYNRINSNSREQLEHSSTINEITTNSISRENNNQIEIVNFRNIARYEPESNFQLEVTDENFRNSENCQIIGDREEFNDICSISDRSPREGNFINRSQFQVNATDPEESSDFQALPDIRESRV